MNNDKPCDRCATTGDDCPGWEDHCRAGLHCTSTTASCAADRGINDHPEVCCDCGFGLTPNQRGRRR